MATHSGYDVAGLTVGAAYTAVAVVWREPGSPVVAVTGDGVTLGNPVDTVGAWVESRVTFLATALAHIVGLTRVDTATGLVHLGGTMLVPVSSLDEPYVGPYFDGSTADSAQLLENSWVSGPFSPSTSVLLDATPHNLISDTMASPSKPLTATAYLRSDVGAEVTMIVRSGLDNEVLGSARFTLTAEWQRYAVATPFGRDARIDIEARGQYDVDQVMFGDPLPFFDGDTSSDVMAAYSTGQLVEEYEAAWTGPSSGSLSTMTWLGKAEVRNCEANWRPFLSVDQGVVDRVRLFMRYIPAVPATEQAEVYERHFKDVACVQAPQTISEFALSGGSMREVDFLLAAEVPFAYGATHTLLNALEGDMPLDVAMITDPPTVVVPPVVIVDPDCAVIPAPPRPPAITNACAENPTTWRRHYMPIDGAEISGWSQSIPTITLLSGASAVRQVRVRFYANPFNYPANQIDPLSYCSEFILGYLPAHTELTVDGPVGRAYARVDGAPAIPASNLLYGTDGVPMTWPELSCGISHVMTIDTSEEAPEISIGLALTRRE